MAEWIELPHLESERPNRVGAVRAISLGPQQLHLRHRPPDVLPGGMRLPHRVRTALHPVSNGEGQQLDKTSSPEADEYGAAIWSTRRA
jgi:hypothetical protein